MANTSWVTTLSNVTFVVPTSWAACSTHVQTALAETNSAVTGVRAVDFGQGDCNAIMGHGQDGVAHPLVYFDLGGGSGKCAHSHPCNPSITGVGTSWNLVAGMIDNTLKPKVILSHWDKDHYYSATKAETKTQALDWLVPRQQIGPTCAKFVKGITTIECFRTGDPAMRLALHSKTNKVELYIEQATEHTSDDRNLNGLVCTLVKLDGTNADEFKIIMPADAPFRYIPSLAPGGGGGGGAPARPGGRVVALFAFHHCSETHFDATSIARIPPSGAGSHAIVTTYGLTPGNHNGFGHPSPAALAEYNSANWGNDPTNNRTRINTASTAPDTTASSNVALHNVAGRGSRTINFP